MIKEKNILTILTLAFLVVIAWVVLSVYHNAKTSTIDDATQVEIQPITPQFDNQVLTQLQTKQQIAPQFSQPQAVPSPTILPYTNAKQSVQQVPAVLRTTQTLNTVQPTGSGP